MPLVDIALELQQITNVQLLLCSRHVCNTQGNFYTKGIALDGCTARLGTENFHPAKHRAPLQVDRLIAFKQRVLRANRGVFVTTACLDSRL